MTDTDPEIEGYCLAGAAAGIPMIMSRTEKRAIFEHGEGAYLWASSDVQAFPTESMIF